MFFLLLQIAIAAIVVAIVNCNITESEVSTKFDSPFGCLNVNVSRKGVKFRLDRVVSVKAVAVK